LVGGGQRNFTPTPVGLPKCLKCLTSSHVKDASEVSAAILGEQVRKVRVWGQRLRGLAWRHLIPHTTTSPRT